jgi:hypothetical protein
LTDRDDVSCAHGDSFTACGRADGRLFKRGTYKGAKVADLKKKDEEAEPKVYFAAQLAAFFIDGVSAAIKIYDSTAPKRVVNLENFRGGPGYADGGRRWRDHAAGQMQ